MNEKPIKIKKEFDPDLAKKVIRSREAYTDDYTGEEIPAGSTYYILPIRIAARKGRKGVKGKKDRAPQAGSLENIQVSVSTYEKLMADYEKEHPEKGGDKTNGEEAAESPQPDGGM